MKIFHHLTSLYILSLSTLFVLSLEGNRTDTSLKLKQGGTARLSQLDNISTEGRCYNCDGIWQEPRKSVFLFFFLLPVLFPSAYLSQFPDCAALPA